MKNLIIHGHFYQPPRENPWTGIIEDQSEAAPFANWNEKICRESYEANAYSPLLDEKGLISSFFNNYRHISFNMGPTLLDWIENHSPHVYRRIIEADRHSAQVLGGGNALSQIYNHVIMPLASERDRKTQILWGLENFKKHFGRDSEGMWLSETAIDPASAAELVRCGIKYTVLSPWQARKLIKMDEERETGHWDPELWQKPWLLETEAGPMTVFFYHPGLSSDISFNHLLRDADYFFDRVTREANEKQTELLSIATDGEIYGHHEHLGNMGLSAFLNKVENSDDCRMVNYSWAARHMEAAGEVVLMEGEDSRGSSWSCPHGVSRWYKDCGCSTGGPQEWNQKWRGPLRDSFDSLKSECDRIFEHEMARLSTTPPWDVRNEYIQVLCGAVESDKFYKSHGDKGISNGDRELFYRLLEAQKNGMFMYTSCGWFFNDISGLEPLQNLMYASRVIELLAPFGPAGLEEQLMETLSGALSNIPEKGNGAVLYTVSRYAKRQELYRYALSSIIRSRYGIPTGERGFLEPGFTEKTGSAAPGISGTDNPGSRDTLTLSNILTGEKWTIPFTMTLEGRLFQLISLFPGKSEQTYTPEDLSRSDKLALMKQLCLQEFDQTNSIGRKYEGIIDQMDQWIKLRLPEEEDLVKSAKALLHYSLRELTFLMESGRIEAWDAFMELLEKNRTWKISLPEDLSLWLIKVLEEELEHIGSSTEKMGALFIRKLSVIHEIGKGKARSGISNSLSGRIFELFAVNKAGQQILGSADSGDMKKLRFLLNLSDRIYFDESGSF